VPRHHGDRPSPIRTQAPDDRRAEETATAEKTESTEPKVKQTFIWGTGRRKSAVIYILFDHRMRPG